MAEHRVEKINGGYILLARQILNSEIMDKPPMFLKLWVWMLERAHHKNGYKGLKRGQFLTSMKELQDAMTHRVGARIVRPNSRKVRYMYERLSNCHMIDRSNVSKGMLITILNYNKYQDPKNYERPSELSHELSHELSPLYNKKECRKKEKKNITPHSPPTENDAPRESDPACVKPPTKEERINQMAKLVIDYLNDLAGKNFQHSESSLSKIRGRLNEGFTVEQCFQVCKNKWEDPDFKNKYFRPTTLFRPSLFESYLNENGSKEKMSKQRAKMAATVELFARRYHERGNQDRCDRQSDF
jgi:uncharacterized phage protein (TIGR02220 family)